MNTRRSSQISFVFASGLLLMLGLSVTESDAQSCPGSRCPTNICEDQGLTCCQCSPLSNANPGEVCACCPSGYQCCRSISGTTSRTCCPVGSECGYSFYYSGCISMVPSVPPTKSCANCDRMYLSVTADDVINNLFIDGVSYPAALASPNGWGNVRTFEIPADAKVIATNCSDTARVVAGVLASTTNNYLMTSSAWKCTKESYADWMQPTFVDSAWPNAVVSGLNDNTDIHGSLPSISTAAGWIWTDNYSGSLIDTPVYCRGRFPTGCNIKYGSCSNLCLREKKTCCGCELNSLGPSLVCSCCPRGYRCCPTSNGQSTCCPSNSLCQPQGQCMVYTRHVPSTVSCSDCTPRSDRTD